jgi:hypothetical protein
MESLTGALAQEALGQPCYEAVMGEREVGGPLCAHGCSVMHLARAHRPKCLLLARGLQEPF